MNGNITVTNETVSYTHFFTTKSIPIRKIRQISYLYDNVIHRIIGIPLGILYCLTIVSIKLGIHCIKRDVLIEIITTNGEEHQIWINRNELQQFKNSL